MGGNYYRYDYRNRRAFEVLEKNDSEEENRTNLMPITIAGFGLKYSRAIRDAAQPDLIFLDMIGPLEAIRGAWASLRNRKQVLYALGGSVKMQKDPGHTILTTQLPSGDYNWTIIQNQAIPKKMRYDMPVYFWAEVGEMISETIPPKRFSAAFNRSAPFPIRPEWEPFLWEQGVDRRLVMPMQSGDCIRIRGFKLKMDRENWQELIKTGIESQEIT